jgi:exodeoxyribonuclease-3
MRIISFNVNGIRAVNGKSKAGSKGCDPSANLLRTLIVEQTPDVLCLQEIKTEAATDLAGYADLLPHISINSAQNKKGYSGVAILSRSAPIAVSLDFALRPALAEGCPATDEGRIITAEFEDCYVVNVYTINSKDGLLRLDERLVWDTAFRRYVNALQGTKPVIVCGDLNCAHAEIDLHNAKGNKKSPGFSDAERESFGKLLGQCALRDSFRWLHPEVKKYSWWSNFGGARQRNVGWRIDYVLVGAGIDILAADCLNEYHGSDHCPVVAEVGF